MSKTHAMGIDVGKDGGIALVPLVAGEPLILFPIPRITEKEVDVKALITIIREAAGKVSHASIEDVHSIFGTSASSNFEFGWIAGVMEAALHAAEIPFTAVAPKIWQKVSWLGVQPVINATGKVSKKGKPLFKTDTKKTSLIAASRLFPGEKFLKTARSHVPHDGLVDAALIGHYCKVALSPGARLG